MTPQEFLGALDWEGGIAGLVEYGTSSSAVPEAIRSEYAAAKTAIEAFSNRLAELESSDPEWSASIWV